MNTPAVQAEAPLFPDPPPTLAAIDTAIEAQIHATPPRGHLGMSQIGKADTRTLWLQFRGCLPNAHAPRTERIFRLGDAIEEELARYLRMVPGVSLHTEDEHGQQFRFSFLGGHFGGSMDGAVIGLPEAPKTWHVWEAKSVSAKRFRDLEKNGVKAWSPEYYAQLQCYMGASGMDRALFMAYCKDDSRIYTERVKAEPQEWSALLVKAERILEAQEPPASCFRDKSWYEAQWMDPVTSAIYWRERLPPRPTCRNCRFSAPDLSSLSDANWICTLAEEWIPADVEPHGCPHHQWIHALCPLDVIDADTERTTYQLPTGEPITNSANGYSSRELSELSKQQFAGVDTLSTSIRESFEATVEHCSDPLVTADDIPF